MALLQTAPSQPAETRAGSPATAPARRDAESYPAMVNGAGLRLMDGLQRDRCRRAVNAMLQDDLLLLGTWVAAMHLAAFGLSAFLLLGGSWFLSAEGIAAAAGLLVMALGSGLLTVVLARRHGQAYQRSFELAQMAAAPVQG